MLVFLLFILRSAYANPSCPNVSGLPVIDEFISASQTGVDLTDGFTVTGTGHRIHKSCFERWGRRQFSQVSREIFTTGIQCLDELAKRPTQTINRAAEFAQGLRKLWKNDSVSLYCGQSDHDWSRSFAVASLKPDQQLKGTNLKYPYIAIASHDPVSQPPSERDIVQLRGALFHEQLHNLGMSHGVDIESPYACSTCCIGLSSAEDQEKDRELACKVCLGDYTGPMDRAYLKDMIAWGSLSLSSLPIEIPTKLAIRYLEANPGERWGLLALAQSMRSPSNPVGSQLAALVKKKKSDPPLTAEENDMIKEAELFEEVVKERQAMSKTSQATALVMYELYGNSNRRAALDVLVKNAQSIHAELNAPLGNGIASYVQIEAKRILREAITPLWTKAPKGDYEAFTLFQYFFP